MIRRFVLVLSLVLFSGPTVAADLAAGLALFEAGEFERAHDELTPLARQGDPRAQYILGIMYLNEYAASPSATAAADWIGKAAEQDYPAAQTELGRMYRTGDGVAQDYAKMAQWYARAAERGDVGAQLFLADAYAYGYGVEADLVQAYMWYEIAIQYWGSLAVRARDVVAEGMSADQVAEAVQLAGKWIKDHAN